MVGTLSGKGHQRPPGYRGSTCSAEAQPVQVPLRSALGLPPKWGWKEAFAKGGLCWAATLLATAGQVPYAELALHLEGRPGRRCPLRPHTASRGRGCLCRSRA